MIAALDSAAAAAAPGMDALDCELKYLLEPSRVASAASWLEAVCLPDRAYPSNTVLSVYFDTPGMLSLHEKLNSDYLKTKIRLRWYEGLTGAATPGPVYLEAKFRIGDRRDKVRMLLPERSDWMRNRPLDDEALRAVPFRLRESGVDVPSATVPMFLIEYRRSRYVEPRSGARISLDSRIRVPAVNPRVFAHAPAGEVDGAVIEVKLKVPALPAPLSTIERLGCLKTSFSKYIACYQLITRARF
jgi:hypothetical protein